MRCVISKTALSWIETYFMGGYLHLVQWAIYCFYRSISTAGKSSGQALFWRYVFLFQTDLGNCNCICL